MNPAADQLAARIAHFEERVLRDPRGRAFLPLADLYRQDGRVDEARRLLELGVRNHPGFVSGRVALAEVLAQQEENGSARERFGEVLERDPDNLIALRWLAEDAARREDWDAAARHGERLLRLLPEDGDAGALVSTAREHALESARVPESEVNGTATGGDEAVPEAEPRTANPADPGAEPPSAVALAPQSTLPAAPANGVATLTLADLYIAQGHAMKARMILEQIAEAHPGRPEVAERLARLAAAPEAEATDDPTAREANAVDEVPAADPARPETARPRRRRTAAEREAERDRFAAWLRRSSGDHGS